MITRNWTYNIDIISTCNLRCPSCPVGNTVRSDQAAGIMQLDVFEKIILKIKRETPNIAYVGLYNWAEPTLHPGLPKMIQIAHQHGIRISLSSNLNTDRNLEELVIAEPSSFRISVSGFSQNIYSRTHLNGDIEKVKSNMQQLRKIINKYNSKMEVHIAYHCYRDNISDQYQQMKDFCNKLDFFFLPIFAYMMPIEKLINFYENGDQTLTESDKSVMNLLAVHPLEYREISIHQNLSDCELRSNQTAINWDGSVALCCGVYDNKNNIASNFLETSHEELQRRKYEHPLCAKCMFHGLHASVVYEGSYKWLQKAAPRVFPMKIPKKLVLIHISMDFKQRLNKLFGISFVNKIVRLARRSLFRN